MKTLKSLFQQSFTKEFDRAILRNDKQAIVSLIYLIVFITSIMGGSVMYFYDMNSYLSLFALGFVSLWGWLVNRAGHPRSSAVILIAALLIAIQFNIFAGFGIHDVAIIAWPAFTIFSGLLFGWQVMPYITAVIMILAVVTRVIPNAQFFSDYSDTGDLIVMLLILLAYCIIAMALLRGNEHLLQNLQQSEERFKAIYNSIDDAIIIQDSQTGAILDANQKTLEMFGYTLQEIALLDILALSSGIPPYAQENALEWIKKAVTQGAQQFEWQVKDKSGRAFWVDFNVKLATIVDQPQVLVSVRDITERKHAEEGLRASENRFQQMTDLLPQVVFECDLQGQVTYANQAALDLFSYKQLEAGINIFDFIDQSQHERAHKAIQMLLKGQEIIDHEYNARRTDGSLFPVLIYASVIKKEDQPCGLRGVMVDIREIKRSEFAIRESEARYRELFDHASLAIFQSGLKGEILAVNPEFARMFGFTSPAEVIATVSNASEIFADPKRREEIIRLKAEHPDLTTFKNLYRRSDGSTFLGKLNIRQAVDSNNRPLFFEGFIEDITEHKRAEEALQSTTLRLTALLENMQTGILFEDHTRHIILNNQAFCDLFSIPQPPHTLLGLDCRLAAQSAKYLMSDPKGFTQRIETIVNENRLVVNEELSLADGRTFERDYIPISVDNDQAGHLWQYRDITERKRAVDALHESEVRYRTLFEKASDGIFYLSTDGKVLTVNESFSRMHGYSVEEMQGMNLQDLDTPENVQQIPERMRQIMAGEIIEFEAEHYHKDGHVFPLAVSTGLISVGGEQLIQAFHRDITERKQAEAALRETEEKFETLFNTANDAIFTLNHTTFLDCNATTEKIFRCSREQIVGHSPFEFSPERQTDGSFSSQSAVEKIEAAFAGQPQVFEWLHTHLDGTLFNAEVSLNRVFIGGEFILQSIVRDITERKRADLQQEVLYQVLRAVSNQLDLELVTRSAVETIVRLTGYPHVCISLLDEDGTHWVVRGAAGSLAAELGATYPLHQGVIGRAFKTGQTQWVRDILNDPNYVRDVSATDAPALRSEFVAPMRHGDRLLGVLNVESDRVDAFDDADAKMIQSLADLISLALENANLYEEAQQEIAERKRTEEALRESEELYRTLFEQASDGIINLSTDLQILAVNKSFARMHGYSVEEIQGISLQDLDTPQSTHLSIERVRRIMAGEVIEFEVEHYHKDGHVFALEVSTGIISVGGQNIIQAFNRDITERKRAEEALRESEKRFRTLIEQAPVAIAISRDGVGLYANPKFMEIFGSQRIEEIIGRPVSELFAPQYQEESKERSRRRSLGLPVPNELESIALRSDGSQFPVHLTIATVQLPDGAATMGFVTDITERKLAEEALRVAEADYRAIFERAPVGIFRSTVDGRFAKVNRVMAEMYGYSTPEEMVGDVKSIAEQMYSEPELRQDFARLLAEHGEVLGFESLDSRKDDSTFWTSMNALVVKDAAGETRYYEGFVTDITERKRAEVALRESEERLKEAQRLALIGNWELDLVNNNLIWSDEIYHIFEIDPAKFGASYEAFLDAIHPNDRDTVSRAYASSLETRIPYEIDHRLIMPDGSEKYVHERCETFYDADGHPICSVGTVQDITERKQHELELEAIATVGAALRTALTRAEMLPVIVEQLSSSLNCDTISVEIIDLATNEAVVEAAYGVWTSIIGFRQPAGTGTNVIISKTRQPYLNNRVSADPGNGVPTHLMENIVAGAGVPLIAQDHLIGFLWMGRKKEFAESEVRLLASIADIAANAIHRATLHEQTLKDAAELVLAYDRTLEGWVHALELRDQETEGHTRRVTQMTVDLARAMKIGEDELEHIRRGALLHDIGKMGIPDSILLKPGALDEREWEIMRQHPEYAYKLLEPIHYLRPVLDIPYFHHEKWDGSGYPHGLKGEDIPLAARIFAIVDVWDALTSDRPYRAAWAEEKVLGYIKELTDKHFDPAVVDAFLKII
jgi:PAS domain S-box-containing protein